MICKVNGCGKPVYGHGWCKAHHRRWWRYGDPLAGRTMHGDPAKFFEEVILKYEGDDCLIWPFTRNPAGYGHMYAKGHKTIVVSRAVCERVNGPAPTPDHEAAHSCGKGHLGCCSKAHIRWATRCENRADMKIHGTAMHGEQCPASKLTKDQVIKIRELLSLGQLQKDIADQFGVTQTNISQISRRKTWASVPEGLGCDPSELT